ncbi:MAG: Rieske (2Fe-2S) protein [Pirellulales bacterium]
MADKKKMSTADILAAARGAGGKGAAPAEKAASAGDSGADAPEDVAPKAAAAKPAAKKPAAKPAAAASGARPSVSDILAQARAGKGGASESAEAKPAPAAKAAPKPKPAAKPAAAKADKPAAAGAAAGPKDTASILAAARSGAKPGPMSKAEAAAKGQATPKAKPTAPPMPVKPAYARSTAQQATAEGEPRRGFLGLVAGVFFGSMFAIGNTAMAATAGLWTLSLARYMFPNVLAEPPTKFKVGFPSDFPPGSVATKFKAQFGVWIVNYQYKGTPEIYALKSVCTHLGCTPNWLEGEQKFKCPCHGSGFYKDGINFEGPAPRPLERYAIRLADDGQIEVDKSTVFFEEKGEWSNSSSFVAV